MGKGTGRCRAWSIWQDGTSKEIQATKMGQAKRGAGEDGGKERSDEGGGASYLYVVDVLGIEDWVDVRGGEGYGGAKKREGRGQASDR